MSYFDDFELYNVVNVRMYGSLPVIPEIVTDCYYLGLITGKVIIRGEVVDTPMVYLTPKGIRVFAGWSSPAGQWRDNIYLECGGARAERFFSAFGASSNGVLIKVAEPELFREIFEDIRKNFVSGGIRSRAATAVALETLAAHLEDELDRQNRPQKFDRILREINLHPEKTFDFAAEAAACGITLRHWNRLFTAGTGMPPHRMLLQCRIRKACRLLAATNLSIKEISDRCGFASPAEFSRSFRKHIGMTAAGYRRTRFL